MNRFKRRQQGRVVRRLDGLRRASFHVVNAYLIAWQRQSDASYIRLRNIGTDGGPTPYYIGAYTAGCTPGHTVHAQYWTRVLTPSGVYITDTKTANTTPVVCDESRADGGSARGCGQGRRMAVKIESDLAAACSLVGRLRAGRHAPARRSPGTQSCKSSPCAARVCHSRPPRRTLSHRPTPG